MNVYTVGQDKFVVIGGELYQLLKPSTPAPAQVEQPSKKTKPAKAKLKRTGKVSTGKKQRIDQTIKDAIFREHKAGASVRELMAKYGLSYGAVYSASKGGISRAKANSGEPLKVSVHPVNYICLNGHHFQSKFPITHARCPNCNSYAESHDDPAPVVEEDV